MRLSTPNPEQLGKTEVGWWIAHNNKDTNLLTKLLVKNYMSLYSLSENESKKLLPFLIAALKGHDTRNWTQAISNMESFYGLIKDKTGLQFNPKKTAELEVGWWKLHDQLEFEPNKLSLAENFSRLYSEIFSISQTRLKNAGIIRAWATYEHDLAEDPNTPPDLSKRHWRNAEKLLVDFYKELFTNIQAS